jgi:hypothetical protein
MNSSNAVNAPSVPRIRFTDRIESVKNFRMKLRLSKIHWLLISLIVSILPSIILFITLATGHSSKYRVLHGYSLRAFTITNWLFALIHSSICVYLLYMKKYEDRRTSVLIITRAPEPAKTRCIVTVLVVVSFLNLILYVQNYFHSLSNFSAQLRPPLIRFTSSSFRLECLSTWVHPVGVRMFQLI